MIKINIFGFHIGFFVDSIGCDLALCMLFHNGSIAIVGIDNADVAVFHKNTLRLGIFLHRFMIVKVLS